jgi:NADP-dependent 3-hydroxy acid dehydrogenase YdfG
VDLTDDAAVTKFAGDIVGSAQPMAALIHCAGVHYVGAIETAAVTEMDLMYRANVHAPYVLSQLLIPALARAKGHVIFVNSTAGLRARPNLAGYSASQHSLRVLADALRDEVNMQGIRVTSIYLGRTATKRIAKLFNAERKVFNPALLLQPDDVAESVLYALSLPATAEVVDLTIRPAIKSY